MKGFFNEYNAIGEDIVLTPDWVAQAVVRKYKPQGRILEPCCGEGVFLKYLPPSSKWCEIRRGKDFFEWTKPVDWIVTNPPYTIFKKFLAHAFNVSPDIVFLIPIIKVFNSIKTMQMIERWGGVRSCYVIGLGKEMSFPQEGYPIAAMHFQKNYRGGMEISFYEGGKRIT